MKPVKMNKFELLKHAQHNRKQHRAMFLEALGGYRKQAIAKLDSMLSELKAGGDIACIVHMGPPKDQTKNYDRAIKMLEMCTDDEIEVDEKTFSQIVLDDWEWKHDWLFSNRGYSDTVADACEEQ